MRGHELRALIIARLEALTPDFQASSRDLFIYDPDDSDDEPRADRSFLLIQGQVSPSVTFTTNQVTAAFRLKVSYTDSPEVGNRIISDGERIMLSLWGINGSVHPDICGVIQMGDWVPAETGTANELEGSIDFVVSYSLTLA